MKAPTLLICAAVLTACCLAETAGADEVVLKNGSRVTGKIHEVTAESVTLQIKWGTVTFPKKEVAQIVRNGSAVPVDSASEKAAPAIRLESLKQRTPAARTLQTKTTKPAGKTAIATVLTAKQTTEGKAKKGGVLGFVRQNFWGSSNKKAPAAETVANKKAPAIKAAVKKPSIKEEASRPRPQADAFLESFGSNEDAELSDLSDEQKLDVLKGRLKEAGDPLEEGRIVLAIAELPNASKNMAGLVESETGHAKLVALQVLGNCATEESLSTLISCMASEDERVRSEASRALLRMKRTYPNAPVCERVLNSQVLRDLTGEAACDCIALLGNLREDRAINYLISRARGMNEETSLSAIRALGNFKSNAARDELENVLRRSSNEDSRKWAVVGLGRMRDTRSVPLLIDTLDDGSEQVREKTASALARITKQKFGMQENAWRVWWDGYSSTRQVATQG